MKKLRLLALALIGLAIVGCSEMVPPGHKGKVLSPSGYQPELLGEGRHTVWGRDKLILLDLTTARKNTPMKVTMKDYDSDGQPRPGLDMDFMLSYRYRLRDNPEVINTMFHDIKVDERRGVTAQAVFDVYAGPVIGTTFREVVSDYTPEEALSNRAVINKRLGEALKERLKNNPISISDVVVTKMVLPQVIQDRLIANKDRELKIAEEQAQQAIELTKRENAIVLARKDAERNLIDAQAAAAQNTELSRGLSDKVLELRRLEIAKIQAEALKARMEEGGTKGDVVFMPFEAMSSVGGQMRMMNAK